jgi:Fic family protein
VFIVQFLAIHPFQEGNGRLSRVLTTLMLLRAGYAYVSYASLESFVDENKGRYYNALRRTQKTLVDATDWNQWIGFFLCALKKQADILNARFAEKGSNRKLSNYGACNTARCPSSYKTAQISAWAKRDSAHLVG